MADIGVGTRDQGGVQAIQYWPRYTREMIRANPDVLFVFGDNLARTGMGGQAREARGEPNAVGIITKRSPSMDEKAFLTNADMDEVRPFIQLAYRRLSKHLENGGKVVFPRDGVGTGLAQLGRRAPEIAGFIDRCDRWLNERYAEHGQ